MNSHGDTQFKPNTTVATVVHCKGKFLLVEEIENGQHVFNQPAGHLEANENIVEACKRELFEETSLNAEPQYLCGIYYFHRPDLSLYFLRFCFVIELDEFPNVAPQDDDIIANHWFSLEQISERKSQLRSAMVLDCIQDYLQGNKIELSALKSNL